MKKALFLALCATSFLMGAQKKCVSFADTEGEGCLFRYYHSLRSDGSYLIYEIKGEKKRLVCDSGEGYATNAPKCK